jgi:hypothetical protein
MRSITAAVLAVLMLAGPAAAQGWGGRRPDLDVFVPIDPHAPPMQWFGSQDHGLVPGTVTINAAPYVCDVDGRKFPKRDLFLLHLRVVHKVPTQDIPETLAVVDGQVHFIGYPAPSASTRH